MPDTEYQQRTDSVLAWKKAQKLGRFDPNAPSLEEQKIKAYEREIEERGERCCHCCVTITVRMFVSVIETSNSVSGTLVGCSILQIVLQISLSPHFIHRAFPVFQSDPFSDALSFYSQYQIHSF